jgi:hypothetical protein
MADEIAKALLAAELASLPIPGTFTPQQPSISFDERMRGFSHAISGDVQDSANSVASALMAPRNALQGQYNQVEINPDGSVNPVNSALIAQAMNMAGTLSLGSSPIPRPTGALTAGLARPKNLPFSESLSIPPVPSAEIVAKFGRIERVPLSQAKATNSLQWDRFDTGQHPPELVPGFGDKPIAVRKENGEYLIYDGHHRTALSASNGADSMEMYVIDAKDYAPSEAGRKSSAGAKWSTADDDLMRELGL